MFFCRYCKHQTMHLKMHLVHFKLHKNITEHYYCGFNKCRKYYPALVWLRTYIDRIHLVRKKETKDRALDTVVNDKGEFICNVSTWKKNLVLISPSSEIQKDTLNVIWKSIVLLEFVVWLEILLVHSQDIYLKSVRNCRKRKLKKSARNFAHYRGWWKLL